MNRLAILALAGSAVMAIPAFGQAPAAPAAPVAPMCGGATGGPVAANDVSQCEVDKVIARAGDGLQIVRQRNLIFGNVPRPAMVGYGTVVDPDNPSAQPLQNARWEIEPDYRIPAVRITITPDKSQTSIVHVVKVNRAWDEGPQRGLNPKDVTDTKLVALRQAEMWIQPHAIIRAAAFAAKGLCPTGGSAAQPAKCPDHKVSVEGTNIINVTLYGNAYKVTLDKDNRPTTVSTTVNGQPLVATYSGYRDGKGMSGAANPGYDKIGVGGVDEIANVTVPLDKYRYGVYYPDHAVWTLGGKTIL